MDSLLDIGSALLGRPSGRSHSKFDATGSQQRLPVDGNLRPLSCPGRYSVAVVASDSAISAPSARDDSASSRDLMFPAGALSLGGEP